MQLIFSHLIAVGSLLVLLWVSPTVSVPASPAGGLSGLFLNFSEWTQHYLDTGRISISRFDTINRIISGTFYFDAINSSGEKIEVRDGRFDVKFINYEP